MANENIRLHNTFYSYVFGGQSPLTHPIPTIRYHNGETF